VLGLDSRADTVVVRRQVGYLPGDFLVDRRQSGAELLTYLGNLSGGVPPRRISSLAERLDLDLRPRIRTLSKGNRSKVGLIQAFTWGITHGRQGRGPPGGTQSSGSPAW
jgi:ABC-2 type transport system ATP-binding protein